LQKFKPNPVLIATIIMGESLPLASTKILNFVFRYPF